ncbi:MAG: histidine phosphatase family protein [Acidimicrobiales bacterium]|nr:histidine phosphatase family protein [Acidimicrobiales bacterium]
MELLFVRHAQPAWSRNGLSVDDPELTPIGHEQAALLAKRLSAVTVDELLVSPLIRARQTAEPIADALGLEPVVEPWLAEIAAPEWEGTPTEEVERIFRENRERGVDELWDGLPGGESFRDFHRRVTNGVIGLLERRGAEPVTEFPPLWQLADRDARILVVAHAGTNATAIGWLLGIAPVPWEWERFVSFHASVSTLQPIAISGAHAFSLVRFSDVSHLPEELQTR